MTILPTKRSANNANNNNEDSKENNSQSPSKERPSRHRDELNTSNDTTVATPRRQFSYNSSPGERNDLQIRFKDPPIDSCCERRERERQKQIDVRRERKRDRQINRIAKVENIEKGECSSSTDTVDATVTAPVAEKVDNAKAYDEDEGDGFNSEDEYLTRKPILGTTEEDWNRRDAYFSRCLMKLGFEIKTMHDDGACLFRAIADQVYGDQELHAIVRSQCMDYIVQNRDYFVPYVTEDFNKYVQRKRKIDVHGNHLEIQALSEMYNRTIEVYCYHTEPINIFNASTTSSYEPIRVSYHRMCHYNSITNPKKPSVLVGLGLPNYCTRCDLDRNDFHDAIRQSEELLIEQTMLEDKMNVTDWEATNDSMEEEIARQSYIQYYQDTERRLKAVNNSSESASSSSTITSAMCSSPRTPRRGSMSPRACLSPKGSLSPRGSLSPKGGSSPKYSQVASSKNAVSETISSSFEILDVASYAQQMPTLDMTSEPNKVIHLPCNGVTVAECDSVTENLASIPQVEEPSLTTNDCDENEYQNWEENIMAQILAESQHTYFEELKRKVLKRHESPGPSTSH